MEFVETPMDFNLVIDTVVKFYAFFHGNFTEIDKIFDEIDAEGGFNFEKLKLVVGRLLSYHTDAHRDLPDDQEMCDNMLDAIEKDIDKLTMANSLSSIESCGIGDCQKQGISIIRNLTEDLQKQVRYNMENDNNWKNQKRCVIIISKILKKMQEIPCLNDDNEKDIYFATVAVLKELVADCALSICGLNKLYDFNYATKYFSQLTAEQQLIVVINMAILTDRMCFCMRSLEIYLTRLENLVVAFYRLNWKVYYVIGLLNFKIHRYQNARNSFRKVEEQADLASASDDDTKNKFFHALLLIAYSYEYNGEFSKAIEKIICPIQEIKDILKGYKFNELNDGVFREILINIIKKSINKKGLIARYFGEVDLDHIDSAISDSDASNGKKRLEILHALAHCLNEYAIDESAKKSEASASYGKILRFARFLMAYIAKEKAEYWTCFSTIHGEYNDYGRALEKLDEAEECIAGNSPGQVMSEKIKAEIAFFRYYFKDIIFRDGESEKELFKRYANKHSDDDAKCYLLIFEFRSRLRHFINSFMASLCNYIQEPENYKLEEIPDELKAAYEQLCELAPTLYMNANVRAELRMLQRAFICIEFLRGFFVDRQCKEKQWLLLQNACCRYGKARQELGLAKGDTETEKFGQEPIEDFFNKDAGILHGLYYNKSIFILAPISGSVVYQYQTGEIDTLFDSYSILPNKTIALDYNKQVVLFRKNYNAQLLHEFGMPEISGINWENAPNEVDEVFYWQDSEKNRILYSNRKDTCISTITDPPSFEQIIKKLFNDIAKDTSKCYRRDDIVYGNDCQLNLVEHFPWIEIINEDNSTSTLIYIYKPPSPERTSHCYFVKVKAKLIDKHELCSGWLKPVGISYKNSYRSTLSSIESCKNEKIERKVTCEISFNEIGTAQKRCEELINNYNRLIRKVGQGSDTAEGYETIIKTLKECYNQVGYLRQENWNSQNEYEIKLKEINGKIDEYELQS